MTALTVLFQIFTIALFTFYLVADGRMRRAILSTLPEERQREVLRVWKIAIEKTGEYIYSRGLLAIISTIVHWIAFAIIGVPFALPLALWVGLVSQFVPTVGTYIAGALPSSSLSSTIRSAPSGCSSSSPCTSRSRTTSWRRPSRPRPWTSTRRWPSAGSCAGASILGVVGALLALPAAATIQAFVSTYVQRHEVVETALTHEPRERCASSTPCASSAARRATRYGKLPRHLTEQSANAGLGFTLRSSNVRPRTLADEPFKL